MENIQQFHNVTMIQFLKQLYFSKQREVHSFQIWHVLLFFQSYVILNPLLSRRAYFALSFKHTTFWQNDIIIGELFFNLWINAVIRLLDISIFIIFIKITMIHLSIRVKPVRQLSDFVEMILRQHSTLALRQQVFDQINNIKRAFTYFIDL